LPLERDLLFVARLFELRAPLLPARDVLRREVRVPVSLARPCFDELRFVRVPALRVDAEREELRPLPAADRAVVFLREERPSLRP